MIILNNPDDVNRFFDKFKDEFTPRYLVLRVTDVDVMVNTTKFRKAGLELAYLGINFIAPVFNELPEAIEVSKNFKHPIIVARLEERGLILEELDG